MRKILIILGVLILTTGMGISEAKEKISGEEKEEKEIKTEYLGEILFLQVIEENWDNLTKKPRRYETVRSSYNVDVTKKDLNKWGNIKYYPEKQKVILSYGYSRGVLNRFYKKYKFNKLAKYIVRFNGTGHQGIGDRGIWVEVEDAEGEIQTKDTIFKHSDKRTVSDPVSPYRVLNALGGYENINIEIISFEENEIVKVKCEINNDSQTITLKPGEKWESKMIERTINYDKYFESYMEKYDVKDFLEQAWLMEIILPEDKMINYKTKIKIMNCGTVDLEKEIIVKK